MFVPEGRPNPTLVLCCDTVGTRFIDHFQQDKHTRDLKGIVAVDLKDLP